MQRVNLIIITVCVPYVLVLHGAMTTMMAIGTLGFSEVPVVSETFCQLGIITVSISLVNAIVTFPAALCACADARARFMGLVGVYGQSRGSEYESG